MQWRGTKDEDLAADMFLPLTAAFDTQAAQMEACEWLSPIEKEQIRINFI